jgi:hypothetical protein
MIGGELGDDRTIHAAKLRPTGNIKPFGPGKPANTEYQNANCKKSWATHRETGIRRFLFNHKLQTGNGTQPRAT